MQPAKVEPKRQLPNVLVTGTPGTGKSTTCEQIAEATRLRHVNVGDLVKSQDLHCGWDEEYSCHIIDEDKVTYSAYYMLRFSIFKVCLIFLTFFMACAHHYVKSIHDNRKPVRLVLYLQCCLCVCPEEKMGTSTLHVIKSYVHIL